MHGRPPSEDPAIKKSVSIPTSLHTKMVVRMRRFGFRSESAYLQQLIRNDVVENASELKMLSMAEPEPEAAPKKQPRKPQPK
ncbi:MAG: hypothetical protein QOE70_1313 [Chthoniobacter sp.]|jgi:hypothetical protein|nr:hypothetical protein [Chthoniobacter sp.]